MIPEQLRDYPLIRVCRPNCQVSSHGECKSPGKRPVSSVHNDQPISTVRRWIEQGGNYGVVARSNNDLVILDSDSEQFAQLVRRDLPDTFTVKTGSGNFHFYYQSSYTGNETFKTGQEEFGSIRTDNYQAVGPGSIHPDTGQEYVVFEANPVNPVPPDQISDFIDTIHSTALNREDGGGSAGGGGLHGVTHASDLQIEPTEGTLQVLQFINSENYRFDVAKVIDHRHPPRQVRVWMAGFLYSVCGLTRLQIEKLLKECADWATDNGRIRTEVKSLIRSSIDNPRAKESVHLDRYLNPGDMDGRTSESRKMEESGDGRTLSGGETMADFNVIEEVTVTESDDPSEGETCIQASVTEGDDGSDTFKFSQILAGTVEKDDTFGVSPDWQTEERNGAAAKKTRTIGSADPDYLRTVAKALEQLADQLDN